MKRGVLIAGIVVVVAVLAGAAYLAARMLLPGKDSEMETGRGRTMVLAVDDGSGPVTFRVHVEPNPELPDRPAEAAGVFVKKEDNSYFVGTGSIELSVEVDSNGKQDVGLSHSGPEIEVVVTHDTVLYREDTEMPSPKPGKDKSQEVTIMQEITPVESLEELGDNCEMQVWGRKQGDRIVAEVLVYRVVEGF